MVKIIVVAHGNLAKELFECAERIAGKQSNVYPVEMFLGDTLELVSKRLNDLLKSINDNEGTLILIDMFGGTPCNASAPLCKEFNTEIIAGVNLPMLLSAMFKSKTLKNAKELADKVLSDGQRSIVDVKNALKSNS